VGDAMAAVSEGLQPRVTRYLAEQSSLSGHIAAELARVRAEIPDWDALSSDERDSHLNAAFRIQPRVHRWEPHQWGNTVRDLLVRGAEIRATNPTTSVPVSNNNTESHETRRSTFSRVIKSSKGPKSPRSIRSRAATLSSLDIGSPVKTPLQKTDISSPSQLKKNVDKIESKSGELAEPALTNDASRDTVSGRPQSRRLMRGGATSRHGGCFDPVDVGGLLETMSKSWQRSVSVEFDFLDSVSTHTHADEVRNAASPGQLFENKERTMPREATPFEQRGEHDANDGSGMQSLDNKSELARRSLFEIDDADC